MVSGKAFRFRLNRYCQEILGWLCSTNTSVQKMEVFIQRERISVHYCSCGRYSSFAYLILHKKIIVSLKKKEKNHRQIYSNKPHSHSRCSKEDIFLLMVEKSSLKKRKNCQEQRHQLRFHLIGQEIFTPKHGSYLAHNPRLHEEFL